MKGRCSRLCIVPPHMVQEMARLGNAAQRDVALDTLALDGTMRSQRMIFHTLATPTPQPLLDLAEPKVNRTIYTAKNAQVEPGTRVRLEGQSASGDQEVDEAYSALGATFDFYLQNYQRNSVDDHGLPLIATVHYGKKFDNAFWDGRQMVLDRKSVV